MLKRGTVIGGYVVEETLGQSPAAVVYRARRKRDDLPHAIKVLRLQQMVARERVILEGRIQQRLRHPNVVQVVEILRLPHGVGLVMEFVAGPTLQVWLREHRPDPEEALRLFAAMVRGVAALHEEGVVHRDIKPANFLLDGPEDAPSPKLSDLGINKVVDHLLADHPLTVNGAFLGSPSYMAPEQAIDPRQVDRRSDLWSLGCILYELLAQRQAFPGDDPLQVAAAVRTTGCPPLDPLPSDLPKEVVDCIQDLLQLDPEQRIQSCEDLWARLDGDRRWGPLRVPSKEPELTPTPIPHRQLQGLLHPSPPAVLLIGLTVAILALFGAWWLS